MDLKMRKIKVALDKKGYHLQYRQYYYAEDPDAPLYNSEKKIAAALAREDHPVAHLAGDSLFAYMEHGAPIDHDIVFRAQFHAGPVAMATPDADGQPDRAAGLLGGTQAGQAGEDAAADSAAHLHHRLSGAGPDGRSA